MSGLLVNHNPTTASRRGTIFFKPEVDKNVKPEKSLTYGLRAQNGRDNSGKITCRHKGGGVKNLYRIINFVKSSHLFDISAEVISLQYDPNRTANIALIKYEDGTLEYMIAPEGLTKGNKVVTSNVANFNIYLGNTMPLSEIPIGTRVYAVEFKPGSGAKIARSAGCSVVLVGKDNGKAVLQMPSGETRLVSIECLATIGSVSNALRKNAKIGKAGISRRKGVRPTVRGVAMNPVDHALGGGAGKTSGGRHPCSPWGWNTKGLKTRKKKLSASFIISRKKKK